MRAVLMAFVVRRFVPRLLSQYGVSWFRWCLEFFSPCRVKWDCCSKTCDPDKSVCGKLQNAPSLRSWQTTWVGDGRACAT